MRFQCRLIGLLYHYYESSVGFTSRCGNMCRIHLALWGGIDKLYGIREIRAY